ncbi:hypothetical protein KVT40_009230 [Elsinoe batatas]|uniref:Uncharacterized protein n=1 Tax=Elsinoe batatas TaxID=2601811 RepID=A0A8K0KZ61_9PEZI|nr:hypothetical protein KVT40_009230 [Elsinoe batatas]
MFADTKGKSSQRSFTAPSPVTNHASAGDDRRRVTYPVDSRRTPNASVATSSGSHLAQPGTGWLGSGITQRNKARAAITASDTVPSTTFVDAGSDQTLQKSNDIENDHHEYKHGEAHPPARAEVVPATKGPGQHATPKPSVQASSSKAPVYRWVGVKKLRILVVVEALASIALTSTSIVLETTGIHGGEGKGVNEQTENIVSTTPEQTGAAPADKIILGLGIASLVSFGIVTGACLWVHIRSYQRSPRAASKTLMLGFEIVYASVRLGLEISSLLAKSTASKWIGGTLIGMAILTTLFHVDCVEAGVANEEDAEGEEEKGEEVEEYAEGEVDDATELEVKVEDNEDGNEDDGDEFVPDAAGDGDAEDEGEEGEGEEDAEG